MQITYFITADYVIQDKNNDKYSLLGIFENFNMPADKDAITPTFSIFFKAEGTKGTELVEIRIYNPDKTLLTSIDLTTDEPTQNDSLTVSALIDDIEMTQVGDYPVSILINGNVVQPAQNQVLTVKLVTSEG